GESRNPALLNTAKAVQSKALDPGIRRDDELVGGEGCTFRPLEASIFLQVLADADGQTDFAFSAGAGRCPVAGGRARSQHARTGAPDDGLARSAGRLDDAVAGAE